MALTQALLELRAVEADLLADLLAEITGIPRLGVASSDLADLWDDHAPDPLPPVNLAFFRAERAAPLPTQSGLVLAVAPPVAPDIVDTAEFVFEQEPDLRIATRAEIDEILKAWAERQGDSGPDANAPTPLDLTSAAPLEPADEISTLRRQAEERPVIRLVNGMIAQAAARGASDLHLEPTPDGLSVRLRIDGVLSDIEAPPPSLASAIISRIKIMAGLDIAERRRPQDGRAEIALGEQRLDAQGPRPLYDLRVATAPALHGETVVIRLLRRDGAIPALAALGATTAAVARIEALLGRSHGLTLVTGPTGSGKTTTLYAMLGQLRGRERKIVTIEDPIEYQVDGITQIPVRPSIGVDFATTLRSTLRHDPDIVMVGETRDAETAETAVQAALTGHLVLTSLHTNDAASAVARLTEMGVEPYLIAATLNAAIAQRLLRRLCPNCRVPANAEEHARWSAALGLHDPDKAPALSYTAPGCASCDGSGVAGRFAVFEIIEMTDAVNSLVTAHAPAAEIRKAARAEGVPSLLDAALIRAAEGETSLAEIARVIGPMP
ncbi:MAG: GspE/PulE family protein [Pseudomonadota bacterium]